MVQRVIATPAAEALIGQLTSIHGPVMFHISGGCCDGSAPMCYPAGEFHLGAGDVLLGTLDDTPIYIGAGQFEYWKFSQLVLDAAPGRGAGFSLETAEGMRFIADSRLFSDEEAALL